MTPRSVVKALVEALLDGSGMIRSAERRNAASTAVLAYHNVIPNGEGPVGDSSLHLPINTFRRQLDVLEEHYRVVPLAECLVPPVASSSSPGDAATGDPPDAKPRVVVTFDDAYAGAVTLALPELAKRGLPATVFVSTGMLGGRSFWWDRLAVDGVVAPREREHCLWVLEGDDEAIRGWSRREGAGETELPEYARSATVDDLRSAVAAGDVGLGAHGSGHLNFAALDDGRLAGELAEPARWLHEGFGVDRAPIAYPYGLANDRLHAAAAEHADAAFLVDGGLMLPAFVGSRPRALPRINVPAAMTPRGLRLRVSGVRS